MSNTKPNGDGAKTTSLMHSRKTSVTKERRLRRKGATAAVSPARTAGGREPGVGFKHLGGGGCRAAPNSGSCANQRPKPRPNSSRRRHFTASTLIDRVTDPPGTSTVIAFGRRFGFPETYFAALRFTRLNREDPGADRSRGASRWWTLRNHEDSRRRHPHGSGRRKLTIAVAR